jgi:hypothetical protein
MADVEESKPGIISSSGLEKDESSIPEDTEVFIDPTLNKRVLRRLDYRFAPLFCALYFMYVFPASR